MPRLADLRSLFDFVLHQLPFSLLSSRYKKAPTAILLGLYTFCIDLYSE